MANKADEIDDPFEIPVGGYAQAVSEKRRMRDSLMAVAQREFQDVRNWNFQSIRSGMYVHNHDQSCSVAHDGKLYKVMVTVACIHVEELKK